jgi:hypothetical protein
MSLIGNVLKTYRAPRQVVRGLLDMGRREDLMVVYLLLACALIFASQWPVLARQAYLDPAIPLQALLAISAMVWLMAFPLIAYMLAFALFLLTRVTGRGATAYGSRLALFWAMLAASPLWLAWGMVKGLAASGAAETAFAALTLGAFLFFLVAGLFEAGRGRDEVSDV